MSKKRKNSFWKILRAPFDWVMSFFEREEYVWTPRDSSRHSLYTKLGILKRDIKKTKTDEDVLVFQRRLYHDFRDFLSEILHIRSNFTNEELMKELKKRKYKKETFKSLIDLLEIFNEMQYSDERFNKYELLDYIEKIRHVLDML